MKKTLYLKLLIAYIIFGFFGFLIVSTFMQEMTLKSQKSHKAKELYEQATYIVDNYAAALYTNENSISTLKSQIDGISRLTNTTIQVVNPSGLIIVDSRYSINVENPTTIDNFDTTIMSGSYYVVGDFFSQFEDQQLSVAVPITSSYMVNGYVIMHYAISNLQRKTDSILNLDYLLLAILFLLSMIILIFFTEIVYVPLKKITIATEEFASGNLHYKLQIDSEDEIGYLAASLAYMASELARGEDNQKHIVANVSHDFRSPLTSIKGYLEAMQDGTIPPEMYEKYIGIVLNETERLIKLTNSLLTLNNLNTDGMILEKSDFDINAMIRQGISTFEGQCLEKKISFNLELTGDSMIVTADRTRIQQVLYNLVDNAIKFSHKNSTIKIETNERNGKLFVSVKDSGIGIPKDSLQLVWNRFYKTDLSRGKDKKGTGLGLSITREIIKAHGENINVISTEGVGTEFIFSLQISENMEEDDI